MRQVPALSSSAPCNRCGFSYEERGVVRGTLIFVGLMQHWPGSELVIVGGAGHDARDPGMSEAVVAATNRFAVGKYVW